MRSSFVPLLPLFAALCAAQTAPAPPSISAVENNFSYTLPGLPNYGIAQGSIFVVFGANLANTSTRLQAAPLQTDLDGVSVQIAVGGSTTQASLYYVMPNQIAGVLPSATPLGTGQIVVTSNGQSSAAAPITVVQSVFGIVTSACGVTFCAAAFDANFNPLSDTNAANPGDMIVLYGTGAGPISTNDAVTPLAQNLTGIPIEVDVGGVPSAVLYHGRSGYPGLDQIDVTVPEGVSGCNVSIVVVSSGFVSNTAFLPVSTQGPNCTNLVPGVVRPSVTQLQGSVVNTGVINVGRSVVSPPTVTTDSPSQTDDQANAVFYRYAGGTVEQPLSVSIRGGGSQFVSLGNCQVETSLMPASNSPAPGPTANVVLRATASSAPTETQIQIDAGPAINFSDSLAQSSISITPSGYYDGSLGCTGASGCPPLFLSPSGGTISINNGKGGPDVGPFVVQMNVPVVLVWSNMLQFPSTLDRAQGLTLTWTGGNPTGVALITATSSANAANGTVSATLLCEVPNSAGQFTIPASALLALPPGSGQVSIGTGDQSPMFTAQGLDGGVVSVSVEDQLAVSLQ